MTLRGFDRIFTGDALLKCEEEFMLNHKKYYPGGFDA